MKNANFMASLKAFFGKAWTATKAFSIKAGKWIVANKLISIPVAVVLVGGIACAIALPIALHEHDFATEWSTDADNHWHNATCSHEEEKADFGAHVYDNACDTTCNTCGAVRTVGAHAYDNACDTTCNTCGATRTVGAHAYDNACDTTCNACGATRTITHDHADTLTAGDTTHYYLCSVCGDKKDEAAHTFSEVVDDTYFVSETDTTATYNKSCVCGTKGTDTFIVDKTIATLTINVEDKVYDGQPIQVTYDTNSNGVVTVEYKRVDQEDTTYTTNAPNYCKEFVVRITVAGTREFTPITSTKNFTISQKELTGTINLNLEYGELEEYNTYHIYDFILEGTEYGLLEGEKVKIRVVHMSSDGINVGSTSTRAMVKHWESDLYVLNYKKGTLVVNSTVVAKEIEIEHEFTLVTGQTEYEYTLTETDGAVYGETVVLKVVFESAEAGAGIVSKKLYVGGVEATNYVLSTGTTIWLVD